MHPTPDTPDHTGGRQHRADVRPCRAVPRPDPHRRHRRVRRRTRGLRAILPGAPLRHRARLRRGPAPGPHDERGRARARPAHDPHARGRGRERDGDRAGPRLRHPARPLPHRRARPVPQPRVGDRHAHRDVGRRPLPLPRRGPAGPGRRGGPLGHGDRRHPRDRRDQETARARPRAGPRDRAVRRHAAVRGLHRARRPCRAGGRAAGAPARPPREGTLDRLGRDLRPDPRARPRRDRARLLAVQDELRSPPHPAAHGRPPPRAARRLPAAPPGGPGRGRPPLPRAA